MSSHDEVAAEARPLGALRQRSRSGLFSISYLHKRLGEGGFVPRPYHPDSEVRLMIRRYKRDVVVKVADMFRSQAPKRERDSVVVIRGDISRFSFSSSRRLEFLVRNSPAAFTHFLTLTYPAEYPNDGRLVKKHLHAFLQWPRRINQCEKEPGRRWDIRYVWVLEFQDRGAPHIHLLVTDWPRWCNPFNGLPCSAEEAFARGRRALKPVSGARMLSRRWYRIVGSRDPRHLAAGTQLKTVQFQQGLSSYMGGYLKKSHQKQVPAGFSRVGRFWGSNVRLASETMAAACRYTEAGRLVRPLRRWLVARYRALGRRRWRWEGFGFTIREGTALYDALFRAGAFRSALGEA